MNGDHPYDAVTGYHTVSYQAATVVFKCGMFPASQRGIDKSSMGEPQWNRCTSAFGCLLEF